MQVTSLEELKQIAKKANGEVIEIPGFDDMSVLNVKVKRVSLTDLVQCDVLPNILLLEVQKILDKKQKGHEMKGKEYERAVKNLEQFTEIVYKQALIEPSVGDFESVGLELNKVQKSMIAEYAIGDTSRLERFRAFRESLKNNSTSKEL
ncbi:hypothetical protein [Romboutsia sp. 1001216sp1]|uniref:hypothetical protein n=1 Tax=Romboutsia sp. 1001216sp1 TaxID=2986997 RepID=UPI00232A89BE|nr:hypothetical protein [Romboutsia sp. 1001216sp1]MDB8805014.1 hypothetical protein [Romboutsia sp. 1001216sp1]MDB8808004.1 hypothetical protein [Romboutsia sp. 1001216sp1]MDB8810659.1 hypothetical protein [Romboutsia sp. 1001216sp1]MDB8816379.1 hypothetical protein [Romboutsia sp. 1001216sp1]MDB8818668.1 hypothetical protein [Romboutsia sp. 1001216sp1]